MPTVRWCNGRMATYDRQPRMIAVRVVPTAAWDDLVLLPSAQSMMRGLVGQGRDAENGAGVVALFTGDQGAGTTRAAEALAGELGVDLYRVDLAGVVSRYIGETEKDLRRLLASADHEDAVLLLEESEALFGTRTGVGDAHDRFSSTDMDRILQIIESRRGLTILATNRRAALDPSLVRRLRCAVELSGHK